MEVNRTIHVRNVARKTKEFLLIWGSIRAKDFRERCTLGLKKKKYLFLVPNVDMVTLSQVPRKSICMGGYQFQHSLGKRQHGGQPPTVFSGLPSWKSNQYYCISQ